MKAKKSTHDIGDFGENAVISYLMNHGYRILEKNFRAGRLGEIDIIAFKSECICFIEVKSRTGTEFGVPSEAVTRKKQDKIRKIAQVYLMGKGMLNRAIRFDVAEVMMEKGINSLSVSNINLIENAF